MEKGFHFLIISLALIYKTCDAAADINFTSITETGSTSIEIFTQGIQRTLTYDIIIENVGNESIPGVSGSSENFEASLQFTKANLENGDPDSLGNSPTMLIVTSSQDALANGSALTLATTGFVKLPTTVCHDVIFLCVTMSAGTGASYVDDDVTNNVKCLNISMRKTCAPDPAITFFSETTDQFVKQTVPVTLSFLIEVTNMADAQSGNDVIMASGSEVNFEFLVKFANADIRTSTATVTTTSVIVTTVQPEVQAALPSGGTLTLTGSVEMTLPPNRCRHVTHLCISLVFTHNRFVDASQDGKNSFCLSIIEGPDRKTCAPNPRITSIGDISAVRFHGGISEALPLQIDIENAAVTASGNDILPVTESGSSNFEFFIQATDADITSTSDSLGLNINGVQVSTSAVRQGLQAASSLTISGSVEISLPISACSSVTHLCLTLSPGTNTSYVDDDTSDNVLCVDISSQLLCAPDPRISSFTINTNQIFKQDVPVSSLPLFITVENAGSSSTDGIPAVTTPSKNFIFDVQFSDVDMSSGTNTLKPTPKRVSISGGDDSALPSGSNLSLTGQVDVTLDSGICPSAQFLCVTMSTGASASYTDADTLPTSNIKCVDVSSKKTCNIDVTLDSVTDNTAPPAKFIGDVAVLLTLNIEITNNAIAGSGSDILASTGNNFAFDVLLSNIDVTVASDSLGLTWVPIAPSTPSDLQQSLGAQTTVTITGTVNVVVPNAHCDTTAFLCVRLSEGASATHVDHDSQATSNIKCLDIRNVVECSTDIELVTWTQPDPFLLKQDTESTISLLLELRNNGPNTVKPVTGDNINFDIKFLVSDFDLANAGVASDTLALTFTPVLSPGSFPKSGLISSGTITTTGSCSLILPKSQCLHARHLCAVVLPGNGSTFQELDATNNVRCMDISTMVTCDVDPSLTSLVETSNSFFKAGSIINEDLSVTITNLANASASNNLKPVSGADTNFAWTVHLSDVDMASASDSLGLNFIPVFSSADLQRGIDARGDITITGTCDITIPKDITCKDVSYLCLELTEGSGASYTDANGDNNIFCAGVASRKTCFPDPSITDFQEPSNSLYIGGASTTHSVEIEIANAAATESGNDIIEVSSPDINYEITAQLSDVDMSLENDTLGLPPVSVTLDGPSVTLARQSLASGASIRLSGSISVNLPGTLCPKAQFICVSLIEGTQASYADADPTNNIRCLVISSQLACDPDPAITTFSLSPALILIQDEPTTVFLNITLENLASEPNSIVQPVSGNLENFAFKAFPSDADVGMGETDTLGLTPVLSSIGPPDSQAGLTQGVPLLLIGDFNVNVPAASCAHTQYICVQLSSHGSYTDRNETNNINCQSITHIRTCAPDLETVSIVILSPGLIFMEDTFTDIDVTAGIQNSGVPGGGNDIIAVLPPMLNFDVILMVSDADITAGNVNADTSAVSFTIGDVASLQQGLIASATTTISGTARVTLPSGIRCYNTSHLCAKTTAADSASFKDSDDSNNWFCLDVTNKKHCRPVFTNLPTTVTIPEDTVGLASTFTLAGTGGNGGPYSYSTTDDLGPFMLNAATGEITLLANPNLDYDQGQRQYDFVFEVDDGVLSSNSTLAIQITNVNEPAYFVNLPYAGVAEVTENHAGPVFPVHVADEDGDGKKATVQVNEGSTSKSDIFYVDLNIEQLMVKWPPGLDYETTASYNLSLVLIDNGGDFTASTSLLVTVLDEDDPPVILDIPSSVSIPEDVSTSDRVMAVTVISPQDLPLTYELLVSPNTEQFYLSKTADGVSINYMHNPGFDHETVASYKITLVASDGTLRSIPQSFHVNIIDRNDLPVLSGANLKGLTVAEDTPVGSYIVTVSATDPENDTVTFSGITVRHPNGSQDLFSIDVDGNITLKESLDFETSPFVEVKIKLCDSTVCDWSGSFNITLTNAPDSPCFKPNTTTVMVPEDVNIGSNIALDVAVTDDDADINIFFIKSGNDAGDFMINLTTGNLSTTKTLDYDTPEKWQASLIIGVRDITGLEGTLQVDFFLTNVNDNSPEFELTTYDTAVKENVPVGSLVVTLHATDLDGPPFGISQYRLEATEYSPYFDLTTSTSPNSIIETLITSAKVFDRESDTSPMNLILLAVDTGGNIGSTTVIIAIEDVNEYPPQMKKDFYNMELPIGVAPGHLLGKVMAKDPDPDNALLKYVTENENENLIVGYLDGTVVIKSAIHSANTFTLKVHALDDNDLSSNTSTVRVDSYDSELYDTDWTIQRDGMTTAQIKQELESKLKTLCDPCVPRVYDKTENNQRSSDKVSFRVHFLTDDSTEKGDLSVTKNLISADTIINKMTPYSKKNSNGDLEVTDRSIFNGYPVVSLGKSHNKKENWLLDTPAGNVILAGLVLVCLAIFAHFIYFAVESYRGVGIFSALSKSAGGKSTGEKMAKRRSLARTPTSLQGVTVSLPGTS